MGLQRFNLNESDRAIPPTPKEVYDFIKSRNAMKIEVYYCLDGEYVPVRCFFDCSFKECHCQITTKYRSDDDSRIESGESLMIDLERTWRENIEGEHEIECYTYATCCWRKNSKLIVYPYQESQDEYLELNFEANSRAEAMERFFKLLEVWKQQRKEK